MFDQARQPASSSITGVVSPKRWSTAKQALDAADSRHRFLTMRCVIVPRHDPPSPCLITAPARGKAWNTTITSTIYRMS